MPLSHKPFQELEEKDLVALIESAEAEGRRIDYKRDPIGDSDGNKTEFVRDATSFANEDGGYIVFGMQEEKGLPTKVCGLASIDADAEILRLEEILRRGARPQVFGVASRAITLSAGGAAIVIRIPRSWMRPHMVTRAGQYRFWSRASNGKYLMEVEELRNQFLMFGGVAEKVRAFREERVKGGYHLTPIRTDVIMMHVIPFQSFSPGASIDLTCFEERPPDLPLLGEHPNDWRYNADGFVSYAFKEQPDQITSYTQIYRNGIIEAIRSEVVNSDNDPPVIHGHWIDDTLLRGAKNFVGRLRQLDVQPPIAILLTLLDCTGARLIGDTMSGPFDRTASITSNRVLVPDVILQSYDEPLSSILKPAFDTIWNASGWPRSPFYDDEGNFL